MDKGDVNRTLPLVFLTPSIVSAIISDQSPIDQSPIDMSPNNLRRKTSHLPLNWNDQRMFLGFET